jgi:hypothetical protein
VPKNAEKMRRAYPLAFVPESSGFCVTAGLLTHFLLPAFPTFASGADEQKYIEVHSSGYCCRFARHSLFVLNFG